MVRTSMSILAQLEGLTIGCRSVGVTIALTVSRYVGKISRYLMLHSGDPYVPRSLVSLPEKPPRRNLDICFSFFINRIHTGESQKTSYERVMLTYERSQQKELVHDWSPGEAV